MRGLAFGLPLSSAKRILISGVFRGSQKTRNQVYGNVPWVRIPPAPPESGAHPGAFSDSGRAGWDPSAASIGAAPHCGDRLFRLTSEPMKYPPPVVIGSSPRSAQKKTPLYSHLHLIRPGFAQPPSPQGEGARSISTKGFPLRGSCQPQG